MFCAGGGCLNVDDVFDGFFDDLGEGCADEVVFVEDAVCIIFAGGFFCAVVIAPCDDYEGSLGALNADFANVH